MDVEQAIRDRRTHKAYKPEGLSREELDPLLELAAWAPNHHLTNPWRFRVVGSEALERLKDAAGPIDGRKLDRAPTLVVCSCQLAGLDPIEDEEDMHSTAVAAYIVLLAAHARGFAGYWRTPGVLRTDEGRAAVGLPGDERFVGLLHLGHAVQEMDPPERIPADQFVEYLD